MDEPVVIQLSRPEVYVNQISFGGRDAVAATLSNDFIHLVDLEAKASKQTLDVAKRVVGIHFDLTGSPVLRAVDDSFGIHLFDIRAGSKKKSRVNPLMENHQVVCSACSDHYIALGSSTFLLEDESKKKTKKQEASDDDEEDEQENEDEVDPTTNPHVISVFDLRKCTDPVLTIKESHSDSINTMAFMRDGQHLISGGSDGLLNIFNTSCSKEDEALQSTCSVGSSINRVGCLSKRLIYACTDDNKCSVFVPNAPDDVDYLFMRNGTEGRFLVDALKGGVDERPVALVECDPEGTLYVRTVSKDGKHSEVVMEWKGHTDIVRSAAFNNRVLVTGGEDGKIVVKTVDLRPEGGKMERKKEFEKGDQKDISEKVKDKKDKKKNKKSGNPY
ncbi:WD40 repeat domain containing protein [Trichostrongylus colubriformis]|uniref:WD repeat-containing protein 89 n=2 Tax=Trichostrongylus colubriformis TaxID=6319 RepID=A0AAN8IRK3_TRICO